jgi:hypothetical protein
MKKKKNKSHFLALILTKNKFNVKKHQLNEVEIIVD